MALDPKDQILMRDAFYEALDRWSSKPGGRGGLSGGGMGSGTNTPSGFSASAMAGKGLDVLTKSVGATAGMAMDFTGKLARGGVSVTDATNILSDGLKKAGGAGGNLATAVGDVVGEFGKIIQYVEEGVDVFRDLSQTGATFGNSVVDMRAAAAGSRLTMREFNDIVKLNTANLSAFGGSADKGAASFAKLSKGFFDSGFGDSLTQLGYTADDLNKLMAIQMTNVSARELAERGGDRVQFESTVRLAEEMDLMAKLTGKSRKEQEKLLESAKADGQVQSALRMAVSDNVKNAKQSFDAITVASSNAGQFGKLLQEMITAGRPLTEESRKLLGNLNQETMAAIKDTQTAFRNGETEAAREAAKRAVASEAVDISTNRSRQAQAVQIGGVNKKAAEDLGRFGDTLVEEARKMKGSVTDPAVIEAARKKMEEEAKKGQAARSGETASVIEAQNRIKDAGSALQESIIVPLKNAANEKVLDNFFKQLKGLNQSVSKGGTAVSKQGFAGDMVAQVDSIKQAFEDNITRGSKTSGPEQKFSDDAAKTTNQSQLDAFKKAVESSTRKQIAGEENEIRTLIRSLKAIDGEAVSKQLEKVAKDQGKSSADVLKEAVNKPGGVGNLNKQLSQDPAAKEILNGVIASMNKQQSTVDMTQSSQQQGRDTSGTSNEALIKGLKLGTETLGSFVTGTIGVFTVQGNVTVQTGPIPHLRDGGVAKGPDSGYLAMLHGEETVIPNKDIDAVISGAISKLPKPTNATSTDQDMESAYKSMQSMNLAKMFAELKTAIGSGNNGVNLDAISKEISTTISAVSSGSNAATKQTHSGAAKDESSRLASKTQSVEVADKPNKNTVVGPAMSSSFNEVRTSAADMQAQFDREKTEKKKTADAAAKAAEEKKNVSKADTKADTKAVPLTVSATATLDDVVSALDHLNKNMSQLLTQSESLGKKQIKAVKSGSGNLYA